MSDLDYTYLCIWISKVCPHILKCEASVLLKIWDSNVHCHKHQKPLAVLVMKISNNETSSLSNWKSSQDEHAGIAQWILLFVSTLKLLATASLQANIRKDANHTYHSHMLTLSADSSPESRSDCGTKMERSHWISPVFSLTPAILMRADLSVSTWCKLWWWLGAQGLRVLDPGFLNEGERGDVLHRLFPEL